MRNVDFSVQLQKLDRFIAEREHWAAYYLDSLAGLGWLHMPQLPAEGGRHSWQAFVTYVDPETAPLLRNQIMARLQERGISTRPGTHAVHLLGYYREHYGIQPDDYPGARDCDANTMAIPLHNRMIEEDYEYVVRCLREIAP